MLNCPSCQADCGPVVVDVCANCGWQFNHMRHGSAGLPSLVRAATRPKIQVELTLAMTIDRTASSDAFKSGIPLTAETVLNVVTAKTAKVTCLVQSHGDLDEGQEMVLVTDCGTPDTALDDIRSITYGGGGDPPEHHLDAIENLVNTVPWEADPSRARGAILAFLTADTKPTRSGITASTLGEEIHRKGVLLYLVCEPTPTLRELCDAASGLMFQISNAPDAEELKRIGAGLGASIVATAAAGGTKPMPAFP